MSELRIITDHKWKPFRYRYEVPPAVLASDFDYQDEDEAYDSFFCYLGVWYHLDEFMRPGPRSPFEGWDGYASDSFFSGTLIRVSKDGEEYQVGRYYS